ncbi:MAG TPA: head GIN domain-containing protein [Allosphingosinicella sp.]|nr:head GIN domain-containing protein [Allosphingosinicella sp.]
MRCAILIPVLVLGACSMGEASENDGARGTRDFQVGAFDKVSLLGSPNVVVTVGGAPAVRAEGDGKLLEKLDVKVENGILRIGFEKGKWSLGWRKDHGPVTVHVSVPSLTGAEVSGSGDMKIDKVEGGDFTGEIAGSGEIQLAILRARNASFSIAGSGGVTANGIAEAADFSIAGSGDVRAAGLQVKRAKVSIAGSGNVETKATESANIDIMGSGDVVVSGGAKCSVNKMGSGDVRCG